jgi:hypothetical protein
MAPERVAVIGSREYPRLADVDTAIDALELTTVVVSGGARGVDQRAVARAKLRGMQVEEFLADWDGEGRKAGIVRNERMIATVHRVLAFWDEESRGTKHAIEFAKTRSIPVQVVTWTPTGEDYLDLFAELRRMHQVAVAHGYSLPPHTLRVLRRLVQERRSQ